MPQQTASTHYLFLRIVAAVRSSRRSMTVADLARAMKLPPEVIGHCIALHLYLDGKKTAQISLPLPPDFWVPQGSDVITREMLEPGSAGLMLAVQAVVQEALRGNVDDTAKFNPGGGGRARRRTKQTERSVPGAG